MMSPTSSPLRSSLTPRSRGLARASVLASLGVVAACAAFACSNGGQVDGTGGSTATAGGATPSSHAATTAATTAASTSVASSSSSGQGGQGGAPAMWPTCDADPMGVPLKTIPDLWTDNPSALTPEWVPGAYVIGVSGAGCQANVSCQIFVQQDESYADFAGAQQKAIKIDIIPSVAEHFTGIAVGDQVDVYGEVVRDTMNGANELKFLVSPNHPGCAKVKSSGHNSVPVTATLDQLSVALYEAQGPILLKINDLTGHVHMPTETFALWNFGQQPTADIKSMSPFFLPNGAFTGLVADTFPHFTSVSGVFGLFFPMGGIKYEEIYIRTMADAPTQ